MNFMINKKIVLASTNLGKIAEIQQLLTNLPVQILPQTAFSLTEVEETGLTFIENALLKARAAAAIAGLPAIADDSGLVVSALNGAPGIYSARYAGTPQNAAANIHKLLQALQNVPQEKRVASFHCTLVFLRSAEDPAPLIAEGIWHGRILQTPTGTKGFGYDPIFFDPVLNRSAAELSIMEKNQISHRGQALQRMLIQLKKHFTPPEAIL